MKIKYLPIILAVFIGNAFSDGDENSWELTERDDFILMAKGGNTIKGDRLTFFWRVQDCSQTSLITFFYSYNPNEKDFFEIEGRNVNALVNNEEVILPIRKITEFPFGFRALLQLDIARFFDNLLDSDKQVDSFQVYLQANESYDFKEGEQFDPVKFNTEFLTNTISAPDYFDITENSWDLDGVSEALTKGYKACTNRASRITSLRDDSQVNQSADKSKVSESLGEWLGDTYEDIADFFDAGFTEISVWFKGFNSNTSVDEYLENASGTMLNINRGTFNSACMDPNEDGGYFTSNRFAQDREDSTFRYLRLKHNEFESPSKISWFSDEAKKYWSDYERRKEKSTEKNLGQFGGKVLFFNSQLTSLGSSYEMRDMDMHDCLRLNVLFEYASSSNYKDLVKVVAGFKSDYPYELTWEEQTGYDRDTKLVWSWYAVEDKNYLAIKEYFEKDLDRQLKEIIKSVESGNAYSLKTITFPLAESSPFYQQYSNYYESLIHFTQNGGYPSQPNPMEVTKWDKPMWEANFNEDGHAYGRKETAEYLARKEKQENELRFSSLEREIEELRGFLEIERETNRLDRELGRQPPTGSIISEAILGALSDYYSPNSIMNRSQQREINALKREIRQNKNQENFLDNRNRNN